MVPEIQLGTAYGVITSVQNSGLAIFPLIVSVINDKTGAYTWVELFFAMLAGIGFVSAFFWQWKTQGRATDLIPPLRKQRKNQWRKYGLPFKKATALPTQGWMVMI